MHDLILNPMQHALGYNNLFYNYSKQLDAPPFVWIPVSTMRGTLVVFLSEDQPPIPRPVQQTILCNNTNLVPVRLKQESAHRRYTIFFKDLPPYLRMQTTEDKEMDFSTYIVFTSYLFSKFNREFTGGLISGISGKEFPVCNISCHPDLVPLLQELKMVDSVIEDALLDDEKVTRGFLDIRPDKNWGLRWIVTEFVHRAIPYKDQIYINDDDHLTILNDSDGIVWQGVINYDDDAGRRPTVTDPMNGEQVALGFRVSGIQKGFTPNEWANLFFRGKGVIPGERPYRAIINRHWRSIGLDS